MDLSVRIGAPELPAIALARFQHREATLQDRVAVIEVGLKAGGPTFFSQLYTALDDAERANQEVQFCYADFLEQSGRKLDAVELVNGLLASERSSEAK